MLKVERLSKKLGDFAMREVSFDVQQGEYFVLLGASGVGKSVLLETLAGILPADCGSIVCDGRDITTESLQTRGMVLVYQDQALFPHLTVRHNIAYGLVSRGRSRAETRRIVDAVASEVAIGNLLARKPQTLSGGEAQRVALARALVLEPKVLLLDEPLSSLDIGSRAEMRALLRRINRGGITILHVTHDYEEAISLAARIGVMENGTIVQSDTPEQIFMHPQSAFVAQFVGVKNFFRGALQQTGDGPLFVSGGLRLSLLSDEAPGDGFVIIRSEDVTVSLRQTDTSARNIFEGIIVDIAPARMGVEVIVDVGVHIAALVTRDSMERLGLTYDRKVFVSVKASAIRFVKA